MIAIISCGLIRPFRIRPIAMRPTYSSWSVLCTSSCKGRSGSPSGAGRRSIKRFEERREVARFVCELALGDPVFADGVDVREVGLLVGGPEVAEQIEHFVEGFVGTRVASIDLVDDRDDGQVELDALRQNEPCLGEGAFGCIHQEQRAVGHAQRALDLTAEVGMSRRVDQVDFVVSPPNRRVLRQNGDAALPLEVVRIHARARAPPRSPERRRSDATSRPPASSCRGRRGR